MINFFSFKNNIYISLCTCVVSSDCKKLTCLNSTLLAFSLSVTIPYNLVVQEVSTSSATLQWKIPLYHPAVILTYIVTYYQTDNITSAKEAYAPGRTTSLVIGGLSSGMSYTFTVRAMTQEGESGYSAPVNATTLKEGSFKHAAWF